MSAIPPRGVVLDLMNSTDDRWSTVRALCRDWCDRDLVSAALEAGSARGVRHGLNSPDQDISRTAPTEQQVRIWIEKDERMRNEHISSSGNVDTIVIQNRERWVIHPPDRLSLPEGVSPPGRISLYDAHIFTRPSIFIPYLRFDETIEVVNIGGRSCWVLSGTVRLPVTGASGRVLVGRADRFELSIDQEWGFALRIDGYWQNQHSVRHEMSDVEVDVEIPDELFQIDGP